MEETETENNEQDNETEELKRKLVSYQIKEIMNNEVLFREQIWTEVLNIKNQAKLQVDLLEKINKNLIGLGKLTATKK